MDSRQTDVMFVDSATGDRAVILETLRTLGMATSIAHDFSDAHQQLPTRPLDLLIADVRLGEYNGLHLVLRGTYAHPRMSAIVTSHVADSVLQREAERLGATFVVTPASATEWLAVILRTTAENRDISQVIQPPFERRGGLERRQHIADEPVTDRRAGERRTSIALSRP